MATSWPGWQELGSNHPNSSTMEAGTTNDAYDYEKQQELLRGARGVLRAFRYQSNRNDDDKDDDVNGSGKTKTTREQTSNCIERCPNGEADGGKRSSNNTVDDVGNEKESDHAASPRSGRRDGDSGDAIDNNKDDKDSKQ